MKHIVLFFFIINSVLSAQTVIEQGTITFERRTSAHKIIDESFGKSRWAEEQKKYTPKIKSDHFKLSFSGSQSLYVPMGEDEVRKGWGELPAQRNTVFNDFSSGMSTSSKQVYEEKYLIIDSIPKIKWRLSNEFREVAGYMCRKATAIIMDSVYVIAFYTESILTAAGPESFNGLPGMILGIAIPRMHVNWMATKVEASPVDKAILKAPTKGKLIKKTDLSLKLIEALNDWGKMVHRVLWTVFI